MSPIPLHARAHPQDVAGPTIRTLLAIFSHWQVNEDDAQHMLGIPRSTYYRWRRDPDSARLDQDTLERASYLLGIYKALQILLPDTEAADSWIRRNNDAPLFGGAPPLARMRAGRVADLYVVRQFLDAMRGGKA